jgi:hydroxyacylglutathione hydrolase
VYFVPMATRVHTVVVGPFAVNCYLLWDQQTSEGVIIDPGAEADEIAEEIDEFNISPKAILLTHGHGDHIAAVADLKRMFDVPLYIGRGEEALLADPGANISAFFDHPIVAPKPDHIVEDEQLISVGGIELLVLSTPGHTAAGVCYLEEGGGRLFCGDTLFAGSIGRTDLSGGDYEQLIRSIHKKILTLPDSVLVFPGHGPQTTVGTERGTNPFLIGGRYA